ncbi:MAG: radical SAM family heme chaperone HemW [Desulfobacterales bacterium]|jgi:oxygen-independent coproporphyrinogen-3 oxidase
MPLKMRLPNNQNAGLYVHIPFCVKKCRYCDFYSQTDLSLKPQFLDALMAEMEMVSSEGLRFDTLYIGGGTPSTYDHDDIGRIVKATQRYFDFLPDAEMTIEVNPGTTSIGQLEGYRAAGINRLNIGVQSFDQRHLDFLGRIHTAAEAGKTITTAFQAGFRNIGIDLIYGLSAQSRADWLEDLKQAVGNEPTHLSCYMLTYEKGTPLHGDLKSGRIQALPDDQGRALFEATIEFLEDNGFFQYEISNFARQAKPPASHISRHNVKYWTRAPYVGLGPAAHSFINSRRSWNVSNLAPYLTAIESGQTPVAGKEALTVEQEMIEAIYLGLRMTPGIDLIWFKKKFGIDFLETYNEIISDLEKSNYIEVVNDHCALTRRERVYLDSIAAMFVAEDISDIIPCAIF